MKVAVIGGTGNIGSAIVQCLLQQGAQVSTVCRNEQRAETAEALGSHPLVGDIRTPDKWINQLRAFDAVIHAACTFDESMGDIDTRLTAALIDTLSQSQSRKKLLYTAGAWCFGNTVASGTDESSPFNPIPEFDWGVTNSRSVVHCSAVHGITIHPSNVVDKTQSGIPPILLAENRGQAVLRVPATPETMWPLVEREDLAMLYCLALDKGQAGSEYIGTSEEGVPVKLLAEMAAAKLGLVSDPVYEPVSYWMNKYGSWARGYALNQVLRSDKAVTELGWMPRFRIAVVPPARVNEQGTERKP